jgi:hypothetical protein
MNTDRIEKQVVLRAPLDRVWRAIKATRRNSANGLASASTARLSPARQ